MKYGVSDRGFCRKQRKDKNKDGRVQTIGTEMLYDIGRRFFLIVARWLLRTFCHAYDYAKFPA